MDNSPRSGYFAKHLDGSDICHVDLAPQQALSAECIAQMARHLGESDLASRFESEHAEITALINRYHWDGRSGFYYDVFNRDSPDDLHNFLNHKTVAGFWPMIAECCREEQINALLRHLTDPEEFWTTHPVASLSKDDPNFDPAGGYWLGGVWPPINYMLARTLKKFGHPELARKLACAHLTAMQAVHESPDYPGIWEAYAPNAFLPATKKGPAVGPDGGRLAVLGPDSIVRRDFVGWSGLGPISLLIEDVLGLDFDAREGVITWRVVSSARHGVEGLRFAGMSVSLTLAEASAGLRQLTVECDRPFTLRVSGSETPAFDYPFAPGRHVRDITCD